MPPIAQPAVGATYAAKIRKEEADIDWSASATAIDRQVRAFDPVPGAATLWSGQRVKLWRARPVMASTREAAPGTVLGVDDEGVTVACGTDALAISECQPAGGKRMSASAFAAGRGLAPGARFGALRAPLALRTFLRGVHASAAKPDPKGASVIDGQSACAMRND